MAPKPGPAEQPTLCWECKNTNTYDCPWFNPDDPQPVPGWVAEPRTMYSGSDTYLVKECPKFEPMPPRTVLPPPPAVGSPGVSRKKTKWGFRWEATLMHQRKSYYLGSYKTAEEAVAARLAAEAAIARGEEPKRKREKPKEETPPSCYPGVRRRSRYWVAYIKHKGKQYHLGYFKTEEKAIAARKAAEEAIKRGEILAH